MTVITDRDRLLRMDNYPQMIPAESRVLRQFFARHAAEYDEFRFNVRIGEGAELGPDASPELRRSWSSITKARPDTVAFKYPNLATLIEVKETFANEGVWQLLAYRDLYARTFPDHRITLYGVATLATPTARALARAQGIRLFLYELPPGPPSIDETAPEAPTDGI